MPSPSFHNSGDSKTPESAIEYQELQRHFYEGKKIQWRTSCLLFGVLGIFVAILFVMQLVSLGVFNSPAVAVEGVDASVMTRLNQVRANMTCSGPGSYCQPGPCGGTTGNPCCCSYICEIPNDVCK